MQRFVILLFAALALSSCSSMKPDGGLQKLADGQLFDSETIATRPPDNKALPTLDEPDVKLRMQF